MRKSIAVITLALLVMGSCKKEEEAPEVAKVKQSIGISFTWGVTDTANYTYDSEGRVTDVQYGVTGGHEVYTYSGNNIICLKYNSSGGLDQTITYIKNSQGYVDSLTELTTGFPDPFRTKFIYDSNGFLVTSKRYNSTNDLYLVYQHSNDGKNLTTTYHNDGSGNLVSTTSYTYFTDKLNTIGNANMGMGFLGVSSKNVVDVRTFDDGVSSIHTNNYTYDNQGRITESNMYSGNGTLEATFKFSYY